MKTLDAALKDLQKIVDNTDFNLPVVNGKAIRIGKVIIRQSKNLGYLIVDTETNKTVETAFSKRGAVAIANAYLKNLSYRSLAMQDKIIEKNVNDIVFYNNGIQKAQTISKKYLLEDRLEIAAQNIEVAKDRLDRFIFTHIR